MGYSQELVARVGVGVTIVLEERESGMAGLKMGVSYGQEKLRFLLQYGSKLRLGIHLTMHGPETQTRNNCEGDVAQDGMGDDAQALPECM